MSPFPAVKRDVRFGDTGALDAFGRLRTSEAFGVFDNKNIHNQNRNQWSEVTSGANSDITYLSDESAVELKAGTGATDFAIRQTGRYFAYVPGKGQLAIMTGVLNSGGDTENVVRRIGYFDDNNGLFFELDEDTLKVVVRSSASGSVVDTIVPQSQWNRDKMDGSKDGRNKSSIKIDTAKAQIFIIDFQWLGVGRVRFGFDIDGILNYCHEFVHANEIEQVYMATSSLPLRYEVGNKGVTTQDSTLKEICCSLTSEGGYRLPGYEYSVGNGTALRSISATETPMFALRLTDTFNSKENRRTIRFNNATFYLSQNDSVLRVKHLHDPTTLVASWTAVGGGSGAEFSTNISSFAATVVHNVATHPVVSGAAASTGGTEDITTEFISEHNYISQNFNSDNSQVFVVTGQTYGGNADAAAYFDYIEFD